MYRERQKRYASLIGDYEPVVLYKQIPGMGRAKRYIITIADDDRAPLDKLCKNMIAAGVTCDVLRSDAGHLFVQHNRFVIADQRRVSLLSVAVDCPRLAFEQMGCKPYAPTGNVRCDPLRFVFRNQNEIGKPSTGYARRDRRVGPLWWRM